MKLQLQRAIALLNTKKPDADQAMLALKPVLKKKNAPWPAYHYMGVALLQKREYGNAVNFLQEALNRGSDEPETHHLLSVVYLELGKFKEAEEHGQKALQQRPEFFKAWLNLGSVYRAQARLAEALKCFQKANQLDPRSAGVAFRIASIYRDQGNLKKALELYDIALKIDGEYYEALGEKARIYQKLRKFDKALECLDGILEKKPRDLDARVTTAEIYRAEGKYEEAISRYEEILSEYPKFGAARVNYALALQEIGRFNQSENHYLKAFEDQPDSVESVSNYLMGLHYNPERTREEIFEAHRMWDQQFAPAERPERPEPYDKDPDRRLRIGWLSGGFWRHPVGWMITLALENLPKDRFEIYCYTANNLSDDLTRRIHTASDSWKSVLGYRDDVIAEMIRDDEIDILVELSGHSADNRLRTVAMEPAPVIVKWVGGLFNTTGLRAVDYLLTDRHETPEGEEAYYTEKLVRMPDDYICFLPPDYAPETGSLPAEKNGYITFGCFNNPTKVNPVVLEQWADIMRRVPESRLILKSKQYDTEIFTRRIVDQMASLGISTDRLEFEGHSPHTELLVKYNEVDIALDPWPYSGGLSTCEALWMGVPVVTLPGSTFAGRHSATHLTNAGLPELVVESWDEYVEKAVVLAGDKKALAEMRAGLREQVSRSPLCDAERFGAHLDTALREMWKQRVADWKSGDKEWRDHIAIEAMEAVEAAETKTSERRASGTLSAETEFGEEQTAGEAIDETGKSKEREAVKTEVETEYSEERKSVEAFDQAGNSEEQETGKSIVETEETDKAGVEASPSGNGVQQVSGDIPVNGHEVYPRKKSGSAGNDEPEVWKIETKDDVTICTPADLNMLTPYVLLEQEQWYEPELEFVRDYLKPGMNVVDVGAGFGVYALPMARKVGPEGKVYAFEPGSLARRHLEMSKLENGFDHTEIIGKAVSDRSGKQPWKSDEIPEQNKLEETGKEVVPVIALDAWWQFEGKPEIDLLKIDINGEEEAALKGAQQIIKKEKPLLLMAISEQETGEFVDVISGLGYHLYEYVPGANILAEHDAAAGIDPYMQNLIAVHESQRKSVKEVGWLYDETVTADEPDAGLWKIELAKLPWTDELMEQWESTEVSGGVDQYIKALNYLIAAEQIDVYGPETKLAGSQKAKLLLGAAQILISLYNQGANSTSVVFTLVRTLHALGKRGQAVEVMQKLIETSSLGQENMNIYLPFMLPLPGQDQAPVKTDLAKWLMVRTVEAWIQLKDLSTYSSGPQEQNMMEVLEGNPESKIGTRLNASLHAKVWKNEVSMTNGHHQTVEPKDSVGIAIISKTTAYKKRNGYQNLRKITFVVPGKKGGAHGLHEKRAKTLASYVERRGIDTELVASTGPQLVHALVEASNREDHAFYTGVMNYDLWLQSDLNLDCSLYDLMNVPVVGFLGDHPYTQFMWNRMNRIPRMATLFTGYSSVQYEMEKIFQFDSVKVMNRISPTFEIPEKVERIKDREIDLLVPWGLNKFFSTPGSLSQQLKPLSHQLEKFGKHILKKGLTDYTKSVFEHFESLYKEKHGIKYIFNSTKTKEDYRILQMLSVVDWEIRKQRRLRLLKQLASLPSQLRIVITVAPQVVNAIPDLKNKSNIQWIGEVSATKLEKLYGMSKTVFTCNPTFPNGIHERVRNAMSSGCHIVTDFSPGLDEVFGKRNAVTFVANDGVDLAEKMAISEAKKQDVASNGYETIVNEFNTESFAFDLFKMADEIL